MARLNFRLQGLLNIKVQLEKQKKLELADAMQTLHSEIQALQPLKQAMRNELEAFDETNNKTMHPLEFKQLSSAIKYYEEEIKMQKKRIANEEKNVVEKRELLNKAVIERKTYEKLKEIEIDHFMLELQVQEQKQLDEIVSFKYNS